METYLIVAQTDPIADVLLTIFYLLMIGSIIKMRKQITRLLEMLIAVNMTNVNYNNNSCEDIEEEAAEDDNAVEDINCETV